MDHQVLVIAVVILAHSVLKTGAATSAWCVCKDGLSDSVLQKTLDYACGAGADCNPTRQNGACYSPNTVRSHCSYAVNSYFQKKGHAQGSCDFSGTATVTASDPSSAGCSYPSGVSATGGTTVTPSTPGTTTPSITTTPSTAVPKTTTTSPYTGTASGGVLGGAGTTLGPSSTNTDYSDGGFSVLQLYVSLVSLFTTFLMLFQF